MELEKALPKPSDSRGEETVPVVFRPSAVLHGGGLLGSLLFVCAGVFMVLEGRGDVFGGWLSIFFFGLSGLGFLVHLIPGSSYLLLEDQGFTVRRFFRDEFTAWNQVSPFHASYQGTTSMVIYHLLHEAISKEETTQTALVCQGPADAPEAYDRNLPVSYGFSAKSLAELMNLWRESALNP